jgi:hypothetical protein
MKTKQALEMQLLKLKLAEQQMDHEAQSAKLNAINREKMLAKKRQKYLQVGNINNNKNTCTSSKLIRSQIVVNSEIDKKDSIPLKNEPIVNATNPTPEHVLINDVKLISSPKSEVNPLTVAKKKKKKNKTKNNSQKALKLPLEEFNRLF